MNRLYRTYIGIFFFMYLGFGSLFPLLSQYLDNLGLSGTQIGLIISSGLVISFVSQPIWGFICDYTQKTKQVLSFVLIMTACTSFLILTVKNFYLMLAGFALLYFFQSAAVPITDIMALRSDIPFGRIRQWGAVGFAVAVFTAGLTAEYIGLHMIFVLYGISIIAVVLFFRTMEFKDVNMRMTRFRSIFQLFKNPKFSLILLCSFFVNGSFSGNGTYFGLLFEHLGGSISGIGLAFLLFAGSESPFMKWANTFIEKIGMEVSIIAAILISALRWLWYSTAPSPLFIIVLFVLQGASVGVFIVSSTRFVYENISENLRITGISIYNSLGATLGAVVCQFVGGLILDYYGILNVYKFFGIFTILGIIPILVAKYVLPASNNI